jgi:hypothetical protein
VGSDNNGKFWLGENSTVPGIYLNKYIYYLEKIIFNI